MSDLAETLWAAFASESAEHLAAIEPLLMELAEPGAAADVPALFRAFHSLKGLAAAMSRHGIEDVAHRAENILGRVRDGSTPVTDGMIDTLLAATDGLRALRQAAVAGQPDEPPPPALVTRLDEAFAAAGGAPATAELASRAAGIRDDSGLGQDEEMLGLFAEMLDQHLPDLAVLARPGGPDETARAALDEILEILGHGAGVLELEALAELLQALRTDLAAHALPLDEAGRGMLLPNLQELATKTVLLGEMLSMATMPGAEALAEALTEALAGTLAAAEAPASDPVADAIATLADALASADGGGPATPAMALVAVLKRARPATPDMDELFALLGDIAPRLASGSLVGSMQLATAVAMAAQAAAHGAARGAGQGAAADDGALARAASGALRTALGGPVASTALALQGLLIAALDEAQRGELALGLAAGRRAYALVLFLEDAPVAAGKLLAWLPGTAQMLSNRSVFMGRETWFEVLLLSDAAPEALRAGLLEQDPDRACLRELRELQVAGEIDIPLDPEATRPNERAVRAAAPAVETGGELRIQGAVIDRFMDAIAETRARLSTLEELLNGVAARGELRRLEGEAGAALRRRHTEAARWLDRLGAQVRQLHGAALEVRIVPIDLALNRLPRVVRTLAREQGKEVDLALEGRNVRVDKAVVDRLVEPLLHMVRNAVDHGIERPEVRLAAGKPRRARLSIQAEQGVGQVVVTLSDDGHGLDRDRILARAVERGLVSAAEAVEMPSEAVNRLIFAPGFSTAAVLTETSGRGVGMDVVLTEVHRLGGEVTISSTPGHGTTFTLRLPLTAATQAALLVRAAGQSLAIPEAAVMHVVELQRTELAVFDGRQAFHFGGRYIPVQSLATLLWPGEAQAAPGPLVRLVIVSRSRESVAFAVDEILRRQELLLLRLHPALAGCPCLGGAAVLGSGEVVLSLELDSLMAAAMEGSWQEAPA